MPSPGEVGIRLTSVTKNLMKVTQEKLPASRVGLEIEIPPEASQQAYDKVLQQFMRNANIPGFRKGKVPRQVLIQRFGSSRLKAAALEELLEDTFKKVLEQEKIDALGTFELRSPFEELVSQFQPGTALTVSAVVDVPPQANLSVYKGLEVQAEEVAYDPAKVDELLESYRNRSATHVPVTERPAQEKDLAIVDFTGQVKVGEGDADLEEIPGGSAQDFEIELVEGKFIPGFIDGILGMTIGETRVVSATFPEPYPQENLAGKPAIFEVTLKDLKEKELPELDDDFAEEISEFSTLAELRESLETRFRTEAEDKTKANKQEALLKELVTHVEVEIPETLVRREMDYMITQTAMRLSEQGMDIKKMFTPEVVESLRNSSRGEAIARIQRTMALGEIAKRESLTVTPAEVDAKVEAVLADVGEREVDRDRLREVVEEDLMRDKIFEWLESNNTVELVPEGSLTPAASEELEADGAAAEAAAADQTVTVDAVSVAVDEPSGETDSVVDAASETAAKSSSKKASKLAETPTSAEPDAASSDSAVEAVENQPADTSTDEDSKPSGRKRAKGKPAKTDGVESEEDL